LAILSYLPATAAPIGLTAGGLPVGLQITGPEGEDLTTIEFARLLAAEIGGFVPPPAYTSRPRSAAHRQRSQTPPPGFWRGTEGSNPASSSGESGANQSSGPNLAFAATSLELRYDPP
jgi:hypothetical protein